MRTLLLLLLPALLVIVAPAPRKPAARRATAVVPNDNRRAAGTRRGDTLTARFTVQLARWAPEGPDHKQVEVEAMTEDGKAPSIPAPMIRVRTGTVMKIAVRNALPDSGIRVFGLWAHPAPGKDTVAIRAGAAHEFIFEAGAPGTYLYGARVDHKVDENGAPERETALGAFIVDSAGAVPNDRVFVMNIWSDTAGNALAINGLSWPLTERIQATTGDTVRWRVINPTLRPHPMHLHGFYFTLLSRGDAKADTTFAPQMRFDEVTERMRNNSTMTMQWIPDRPGNWAFHCHIAFHVVPEAAQLAADSTHDEAHSANANEHMRGLIVGITVKPRRSFREESRAGVRPMHLDVSERAPRPDRRRRLDYRLAGASEDSSWHVGGPLLLLQQGQPTDITVTNHMREPTAVHWHGIELESYSDGIAGWSGIGKHIMPVIAPADSFTARLSLPRSGTFIYHTHLGDLEQLTHGLYGAIVVMPKGEAFNPAIDHVYLASIDGAEDLPFIRVNGDSVSRSALEMRVGETHRLRFINIAPAIDLRWILQRDSTSLSWLPLAKDGTDLPTARRTVSPANVRLAVGETRDVLFTPAAAGEFKLRVTPAPNVPGWTQRIIVRPRLAPSQALDTVPAIRIDSVFAAFATPNSPGCALAVTRRGAIVYEKGYGMASLEQGVPITPRTVFDLGSVSKQFTATSVLLLQLDGKLSLDDDVRRYLPELPSLGASVTLRHLITHTSGWRDYNDLLMMDGFDERDHTTDRDAWESLKRQRALNFPPGATYRYSNTGFFLLGEVVKRVSGRTLAAFAQERIFAPLGMSHTRYLDDTRQIVAGRATAYAPDGKGFVVEMSNWDQVGDGAVQSSVEDLARWEANFDSGVVGGQRLMDLLLTNGRLNDGTEIAYTAGLSKTTYRGAAVVSHGGAWAGYRAQLVRVPAERVGVLITCNRADAGTGNLSNRVLDVLTTLEAPRPIATANGERHEGFFVSEAIGSAATFETRGDTLFQVAGAQRLPYSRTGDGTFVNAASTVRLRFAGTRVIRVVLGDVADTLSRSTRVTAFPNDRLADYVGTYASPEIATSYRVMVRDSVLVLRRSHGDDLPLAAVYTDGFDAESLPTIRFVRDAGGRVTAMSFTGRGIHDLRLARR